MKIIDTHVHLSHIHSFKQFANSHSRVDYSPQGLQKEMKSNNVVLAIGMGMKEIEGGEGFPDDVPSTPLGLDMLSKQKRNIFYCVGINPYQLGRSSLHQLEKELLSPNVVGMKIFLGDFPFYAYDKVYEPVYELAKAYKTPIVFHTGYPYSKKGLLKFSHPLTIDEVATKHKEVTFILSQIGFPWIVDAIVVMMKNDNVFAIVSNFINGNEEKIKKHIHMAHYIDYLKQGLALCDGYEKFMFGSNWPFVPLKPYIQLIKQLFPRSSWDALFYRNAINIFPKLKGSIRDIIMRR